jgi:hypothetical protein
MKTVKIDDDLFQRAEKLAVERGLSVDDLVSDLVAKVTGGETPEAYRARMEMVEMARTSHRGMIGEWNREEAYAERLSRYERSDLRGDLRKDPSDKVEEGDGNPRSE